MSQKGVALAAACLVALLLVSCRTVSSPELISVRRSQPLLGTFVVITAYGHDAQALNTAVTAGFNEVRRIDALMSLHRPDSELVRLNESAANGPVTVSPELFEVIFAGQQIAHATGGAFDLTVRPLVDLWGFIWKDHRLPSSAELAAALPKVGYQLVTLEPATRRVSFKRPGVSLDLGGIGKGYAVDAVIRKIRELGVARALVRAGGDLRVLGLPPKADYWEVQLEDPARKGRRTLIRLREGAVSTSGDYENFFIVDGQRYSHIVNPKTGLPTREVVACSVAAPTCMESDAWATAACVMGVEKSLELLQPRYALRFRARDEKGRQRDRATPNFPRLPHSR